MEKNRYIDVLYKPPNKRARRITIENNLKSMQKLVEGNIEILIYKDVLLVCNKYGKMRNLEPNLSLKIDNVYGSFFLAGNDFENADFISLTERQIRKYRREFKRQKEIQMQIEYEMEAELE